MFDQKQHDQRLERARNRAEPDSDFLIKLVADDMVERLSAVNRTFDQGIALFARTPYLADKMKASEQIASVQRVEETIYIGETDAAASPMLLEISPQSVDLILAPLTLHWSNDLPGTFIQLTQALKPDGLLLAALPGPDTLHELRTAMLAAESEVTGGAAQRIDAFTDIRDAGSLLQRTGFALPVIDQEVLTVRYDTAIDLIRDLRNFGATFHMDNAQNPTLSREVFTRMNEIYAEQFSDADGRIRSSFSIISLSGWAPHESQQKPLAPGSAKIRLADALKVEEKKL